MMARINTTLAELRAIVTGDDAVDLIRCRRLLLRATSAMSDLQHAAEMRDRAALLMATLELAGPLGGERQYQIDMIMDVLDEIEDASRVH